jgi:hypothetical protein
MGAPWRISRFGSAPWDATVTVSDILFQRQRNQGQCHDGRGEHRHRAITAHHEGTETDLEALKLETLRLEALRGDGVARSQGGWDAHGGLLDENPKIG